jgi:hypothetical protein
MHPLAYITDEMVGSPHAQGARELRQDCPGTGEQTRGSGLGRRLTLASDPKLPIYSIAYHRHKVWV